jgi:hypothetical protein
LDFILAPIAINTSTESPHRQEVHHLREQGPSSIQGLILQNDQSQITAKIKSMTVLYEPNGNNINVLQRLGRPTTGQQWSLTLFFCNFSGFGYLSQVIDLTLVVQSLQAMHFYL